MAEVAKVCLKVAYLSSLYSTFFWRLGIPLFGDMDHHSAALPIPFLGILAIPCTVAWRVLSHSSGRCTTRATYVIRDFVTLRPLVAIYSRADLTIIVKSTQYHISQ